MLVYHNTERILLKVQQHGGDDVTCILPISYVIPGNLSPSASVEARLSSNQQALRSGWLLRPFVT